MSIYILSKNIFPSFNSSKRHLTYSNRENRRYVKLIFWKSLKETPKNKPTLLNVSQVFVTFNSFICFTLFNFSFVINIRTFLFSIGTQLTHFMPHQQHRSMFDDVNDRSMRNLYVTPAFRDMSRLMTQTSSTCTGRFFIDLTIAD